MLVGRWGAAAALPGLLIAATPASAQSIPSLRGGVEGMSDHRLRGLSWSNGKPTARAWADVPLLSRTAVEVDLAATHRSTRAAGASTALSIGLRQGLGNGPVRVDAGGGCRIFPGRSGATFCELRADAAYDIAWLSVDAGIAYAPRQNAIGGDNLYLHAGGRAAIPGLPVSLHAGVGHSSGRTTDAGRAARLRPEGRYSDYQLGAIVTRDRLSLGLRYVGTDKGDGSVVGHLGIDF